MNLEGAYDVTPDEGDMTLTMVLQEKGDTCEATVAPEFWPAAQFEVVVSDEKLTLTAKDRGAIYGTYASPTIFREFEWTVLTFPRASSGPLSGTFDGAYRYHHGGGDWGGDGDWEGSGTVAKDVTQPSIRVRRKQNIPPLWEYNGITVPNEDQWMDVPDAMLPWDTIQVEASEPLTDLSSLSLHATEPPQGTTASAWTTGELEGIGPASGAWASTRFDDWLAVSGTTQAVSVDAAIGAVSGQQLLPQSVPFAVLDVGVPRAAFEFDAGMDDIGSWGDVTWLDSDGQVRLRRECYGAAGVAMIVDTSQATQIHLRATSEYYPRMHAVGGSGSEREVSLLDSDGEWYTISIDTAGESMVGLRMSLSLDCHYSKESVALIDWVRAVP